MTFNGMGLRPQKFISLLRNSQCSDSPEVMLCPQPKASSLHSQMPHFVQPPRVGTMQHQSLHETTITVPISAFNPTSGRHSAFTISSDGGQPNHDLNETSPDPEGTGRRKNYIRCNFIIQYLLFLRSHLRPPRATLNETCGITETNNATTRRTTVRFRTVADGTI